MNKLIILLLAFILVGCVTTSNQSGNDNKIYKYYAQTGIGENRTQMYMGSGNYFYRDLGLGEIEKTHEYAFSRSWPGARGERVLGIGGDSQSIFSEGRFPDASMAKWFSPFENKIWVAQFKFDPVLMNQLKRHVVYEPFKAMGKDRVDFINPKSAFTFVHNVGYAGKTAMWVASKGEQYLVGYETGYAIEVRDKAWSYFMHNNDVKNRQDGIDELLKRMDPNNRAYNLGNVDRSGRSWDRRMQRYNWDLVGGNAFAITDFQGTYLNGEQYYIYQQGGNAIRDKHAVPYKLHVFIQNRTKRDQYERIHVNFNPDYMLKTFERVTKGNPNMKLTLKLDVNEQLDNITVTLISPEGSEELKFTEAILMDLEQ